MTCIVVVRGKNGILFVSDGITYDDDGRTIGFCTKVIPMPHMDAALGWSGAGGFGSAVWQRLSPEVVTFDELKSVIVEHARDTMEDYERFYKRWDTKSTLILGGWSDENQKFETYAINSYVKQQRNMETGETVDLLPWELREVPYLWASHFARPPSYEQAGLKFPDVEDSVFGLDEIAIRMVCASRLDSRLLGDDDEREEGSDVGAFNVGGFLQMTFVQRDSITQKTIHRWPDKLGERVDTHSGDLIPPYLTQQTHGAEDDNRS